MTYPSWLLPALAEESIITDMARGFNDPESRVSAGPILFWLVGALLLAGTIVLVWRGIEWIRGQRGSASIGLFLELCRTHRLSWKDSWFLWQLARRDGLIPPSRLFLEPERFQPRPNTPVENQRLSILAKRLFSDLSGEKAT